MKIESRKGDEGSMLEKQKRSIWLSTMIDDLKVLIC